MTSIRRIAEEDESDSSCVFSRPSVHRIKREQMDEEADENRLSVQKPVVTEPPIIVRKISREQSVRVEPISVVKSLQRVQPTRNRIDKIADTLKINLLQKKCLEERQTAVETTASLCQKYRLKLMQNLNKLEQDANDRDAQSMPNLAWLGTYSLSSTGFTPLSPPISPPSVKVLPLPVGKLTAPMVKPMLNPYLKLNYGEDEADGCHPMKTTHNARPNYTYSCLTFLAIESSPKKRLSVKDIYTWIIENFPYYQSVPSGSWKNSIRHNLTLNQVFSKVDKNLLAMRDFSGKGSLWCINPEHRQTLVDQFNQCRLGNEFSKLSAMPQLQDTVEHPTVHVQAHQLPKIHCNVTNSSSASFRSRLPNSFSQAPSKPIINPRIAEKMMLTSGHVQISGKVQPKLTSITKVSTLLKAAHSSANIINSTNIDQSNDSYNEMDAVTALLSMKSRASSVPLICTASAQPTTSSAQKTPTNSIKDSPSTSSNNTSLNSSINSTTLSSSDANETATPKKGRRKQLFKTPTKKVQNDDDTCDSLEQVDTLSEELNHFDDDSIDEPAEMNLKKPRLTLPSEVNKLTPQGGKKSKKLLVKFSSFQNRKPTVSELKPTTKMTEIEDTDQLSDDYEERPLKIDEELPQTCETESVRRSMRSSRKKSKLPSESHSSTNLLLELSRAASMVERHNK